MNEHLASLKNKSENMWYNNIEFKYNISLINEGNFENEFEEKNFLKERPFTGVFD